VKVAGTHLERADTLVRELKSMECESHYEDADVHLIVAQDGSVQASPSVLCCEPFRTKVRTGIEEHNSKLRR